MNYKNIITVAFLFLVSTGCLPERTESQRSDPGSALMEGAPPADTPLMNPKTRTPDLRIAERVTDQPGLRSIDTGYTISKIRMGQNQQGSFFMASSYEGTLLAYDERGHLLWKNKLSGFMNRDVWCADLNGDGDDEILAANADGHLYCLDSDGQVSWTFKPGKTPMSSVCVLPYQGAAIIACGAYDMKLYYLSNNGELLKTIACKEFSREKSWGKPGQHRLPPKTGHVVNFLRPFKRADGSTHLAMHGSNNQNQGRGGSYLFEPMEDLPYHYSSTPSGGPVGDLHVADVDDDGNDEILLGASTMVQDAALNLIDIDEAAENKSFRPISLRQRIDGFGYRVLQSAKVTDAGTPAIFVLFGSKIILLPTDLQTNWKETEVLANRFSFNDMWKDPLANRIVLASSQSGGSCIHVLNLDNPDWKDSYRALQPPGKITAILGKTEEVREQLQSFTPPSWERKVPPVTFMTENKEGGAAPYIANIEANYDSPIFLKSRHLPRVEEMDRSSLHPVYQKRRDSRKKYVFESDTMANQLTSLFEGQPGIAYWGGHGNDPFQLSFETQKKIFDAAGDKKVVTIYPELEQYDEAFGWVMENHFYPMAEYVSDKDVNIFVRTKHVFWNGTVYLPIWHRLLSGEFADVFVPALEETTDKTMELSVAARLGIWASGAVNQWGARCARDNTSYDRLRQHSHQELPNHFLRQMIYNISCGATYLNNFAVDQAYMSILWELVAKGALYVPDRNQLLSLNPVHLSMTSPDKYFLDTGNNVKWITFYDEEEEASNPMVFERLNGTWPGSPVQEWDFSRYAADVHERRLGFLPPYPNGIVMLTPPQKGAFADPDAPRGNMVDHLHPLYQGILKEYLTDGRDYISADGSERFPAKEYYKTIEAEIKAGAKKLPLTVSGEVAWVTAQTDDNHLRLTLIDSGYINPADRTAVVDFHTITPATITDLLSGETFKAGSSVEIPVACGMFRFLDIEFETLD